MANDNSRPDVAVFIDFENIYVSVRDKLDANPNFESIMDRCSELGRVVISRAYADWYRYPRVTSALYANGVEPMYVPTYYYDKDMGRTGRAIKNSADMNMCIDAMKTLFTNTNIAKFVLVTGDRDFIPLVNMIRQQGKDVIIIGIGGAASTHLAQSADEFIFYEQLIGKSTAATMREAARDRERQRAAERARAAEQEVEPVAPAPAPTPAPMPTRAAAPTPAPAPVAEPAAEAAAESDPFDTLVEAVHLARKRGYVCTLGSLKLVMKELMGGEFRESRYKDVSGKPFAKFKDFVQDAERRGKVQIFTNGTINEVFLPGEDPYKLSQFAGDLKEEPPELKVETPVTTNGRQPARAGVTPSDQSSSTPAGRSRRRRRSRGGRQVGQNTPLAEELINDEETDDLDLADTTSDDTEELTALAADDLFESDLVEEDDFAIDPLLIADDLVTLPTDDELDAEELPDLDRLEPIDDDVVEEATSYDIDEAAVLAEVESIDETAAALVADIQAERSDEDDQADQTEFTAPDLVSADEPFLEAVAAVSDRPLPFLMVPEPPTHLLEADQNVTEEAPASESIDDVPPETPTELAQEQTPDLPEATIEPIAELVTTSEEEAPAAEASADEQSADAEPVVEEIAFSDEEWQIFREMMAGFTKPVSFAQIFDSLRGLRQQQRLNRTNEQLRTLAKQAINGGMLERSGRGTRVYYRLPQTDEA